MCPLAFPSFSSPGPFLRGLSGFSPRPGNSTARGAGGPLLGLLGPFSAFPLVPRFLEYIPPLKIAEILMRLGRGLSSFHLYGFIGPLPAAALGLCFVPFRRLYNPLSRVFFFLVYLPPFHAWQNRSRCLSRCGAARLSSGFYRHKKTGDSSPAHSFVGFVSVRNSRATAAKILFSVRSSLICSKYHCICCFVSMFVSSLRFPDFRFSQSAR